jgi:hypothetical protein
MTNKMNQIQWKSVEEYPLCKVIKTEIIDGYTQKQWVFVEDPDDLYLYAVQWGDEWEYYAGCLDENGSIIDHISADASSLDWECITHWVKINQPEK